MSATLPSDDYAPSAYRGQRKTSKRLAENRQGAVFRKSWTMGPSLPRGKPSGLVPPGFLGTWHPAWLRDLEAREKRKDVTELEERHTYHGRLDEECLRYATLPRVTWVLIWIHNGGRILFTWLLPIFLLVFVFGWTQEPASTSFKEYFWDGIFPFLAYFFLPTLMCWGAGSYMEKKHPKIMYQEIKGPLWELNRRTGMVTLFRDPEKEGQSGEIRAQAPFHEWDGYLLTLPDHQGNVWHKRVLVHQTEEWVLPMNQLVPATTNREDVLAYWDLINQYMDVTQPLPDIPLFEGYRHLDPTTRAHDERTGRDPRHWRAMDDASYEAFKEDNWQRLIRQRWD